MAAIRFIAAKGAKQTLGFLQIACHVKPGASHKRAGILDVTDDTIELAVSAQAKEGEANKAVRELIAKVLRVPKSDVQISKGMKSRDKIVVVQQQHQATGEKIIAAALFSLKEAIDLNE